MLLQDTLLELLAFGIRHRIVSSFLNRYGQRGDVTGSEALPRWDIKRPIRWDVRHEAAQAETHRLEECE